jgi:hypothetical protein
VIRGRERLATTARLAALAALTERFPKTHDLNGKIKITTAAKRYRVCRILRTEALQWQALNNGRKQQSSGSVNH